MPPLASLSGRNQYAPNGFFTLSHQRQLVKFDCSMTLLNRSSPIRRLNRRNPQIFMFDAGSVWLV
jgi:hypothetical protein